MYKFNLIIIACLFLLSGRAYPAGNNTFIPPNIIQAKMKAKLEGAANIKTNNEKTISAFNKFNSGYNNKWRVKYNGHNGTVERMSGSRTESFGKYLEQAGKNFLKNNYALFKINTDSIRFTNETSDGKFIHVSYHQFYKNIPVDNGYIKMSYSRDKRLIALYSKTIPDIELSVQPKITPENGTAAALRDLNSSSYEQPNANSGQLTIYQDKENGHIYLAYKISIFSHQPLGCFIYYIDAFTGDIITKINNLRFDGYIYGNILPLYYNSAPSVQPLRNEYVKVNSSIYTTDNLGKYSPPNGPASTSFEGPNFKVINNDTSSTTYNFTFTDPASFTWLPGATTHMDELNMFYHLEIMQEYFIKLGGTKIHSQTPVYVHNGASGSEEDYNAFYNSLTGGLYFGDGDGATIQNFALTAQVIYHEYTHKVMDHIYISDTLNKGEQGSIDEAISDYFACSKLNQPVLGINLWPILYYRDLDSSISVKKFPQNWGNGEVHDTSMIYSQALWDIRTNLGNNTADTLVYQSLYFEPDSYNSGLEAVLMAADNDGDLSTPAPYDPVIKLAFAAHGIPSSRTNPIFANDLYEPNNGTEDAYPIVFNKSYSGIISYFEDFDYFVIKPNQREQKGSLKIQLDLPKSDSGEMYYPYFIVVLNKYRFEINSTSIPIYEYNSLTPEKSFAINIKGPIDDEYYIRIIPYYYFTPSTPYKLTCTQEESGWSDVKVFPNPYKPNAGKTSSGIPYNGSDNSGIIFQKLGKNPKIKIYDLKGRLIFEKELPNIGWWQWNAKDSNGKDVPSGIYIYIFNDTAKGKFAIIR